MKVKIKLNSQLTKPILILQRLFLRQVFQYLLFHILKRDEMKFEKQEA